MPSITVNDDESSLEDKSFFVRWFYFASRPKFIFFYLVLTTVVIFSLIACTRELNRMENKQVLTHVLIIIATFIYISVSLYLWSEFDEKDEYMKRQQQQNRQRNENLAAREDSSSTQGGGPELPVPIISEGADSNTTTQLSKVQVHETTEQVQDSAANAEKKGSSGEEIQKASLEESAVRSPEGSTVPVHNPPVDSPKLSNPSETSEQVQDYAANSEKQGSSGEETQKASLEESAVTSPEVSSVPVYNPPIDSPNLSNPSETSEQVQDSAANSEKQGSSGEETQKASLGESAVTSPEVSSDQVHDPSVDSQQLSNPSETTEQQKDFASNLEKQGSSGEETPQASLEEPAVTSPEVLSVPVHDLSIDSQELPNLSETTEQVQNSEANAEKQGSSGEETSQASLEESAVKSVEVQVHDPPVNSQNLSHLSETTEEVLNSEANAEKQDSSGEETPQTSLEEPAVISSEVSSAPVHNPSVDSQELSNPSETSEQVQDSGENMENQGSSVEETPQALLEESAVMSPEVSSVPVHNSSVDSQQLPNPSETTSEQVEDSAANLETHGSSGEETPQASLIESAVTSPEVLSAPVHDLSVDSQQLSNPSETTSEQVEDSAANLEKQSSSGEETPQASLEESVVESVGVQVHDPPVNSQNLSHLSETTEEVPNSEANAEKQDSFGEGTPQASLEEPAVTSPEVLSAPVHDSSVDSQQLSNPSETTSKQVENSAANLEKQDSSAEKTPHEESAGKSTEVSSKDALPKNSSSATTESGKAVKDAVSKSSSKKKPKRGRSRY